jgi:phage tail sheath protein FI
MPEQFLHGVEIVEVDDGPRPIRTVRSSVIGIVGTAPDAVEGAFPLNTPVQINGSRAAAAKLGLTGTLPVAVDGILDQIGATILVVRVEEGGDDDETMDNIVGASTGLTGVHALLACRATVGQVPRVLIAPGWTHQRPSGVKTIAVGTQGSGYTSAPAVSFTGGGGTGAEAVAVLGTGGNAGKVIAVNVTKPGRGYTAAPTVVFTGGGGTGAAATATIGALANPVVAELVGIADRLRGVIIADGPNSADAAAIDYAEDFGSRRVYLVDPWVSVLWDGDIINTPASAHVAGLIARIDVDRGFWWSPSNQVINGILGTSRPIDFALGDPNSQANALNEANVATIIREDGFRLWGNRTLSSDPTWAFLSVVRTADIIKDSILRAHLWAVDRNITRTYLEEVSEGVNAYLRTLTATGAILGGRCLPNPDLNTPANIQAGKVYFDFDFTPPYPAEHVIFQAALVGDYIEEIVS